jgi:Uma2 family endonuclease
MSAAVTSEIVYPESDGKRIAENTLQLQWIILLASNLMALFRRAADVFVGSDLLWYPVEGEPGISTAPDAFVVFGRSQGHRGSYRQWEEGGVPMTVVFEIWSPGNDPDERMDKRDFYDLYGVEEYYAYDPNKNSLMIFLRGRETLRRIYKTQGFVSPRLGIRFDTSGPELAVFGPDGRRYLSPSEAADERDELIRQADDERRRAGRLAALLPGAVAGRLSPEEAKELEALLAGPSAS